MLAEAAHHFPWRWPRFALPAAAVAAGALLLSPYPQRTYAFEYLTGEYTFPTATVDMMNANGLSGNVFAYYNWGGFLHLKTQGRLKVYIDGRASAVFKAGTYLNYARVEGMARGWVGIVEGSGASYFLWPRNLPRQLASLKQTGHWESVYTDANSELLVRKGYPLPTPLKDPPATICSAMRRCIELMENGRLADAEACARRLRDQSPTSFLPYNMLIQVQINQGKPADARATLESLQRIFPLPEYAAQIDQLIRARTKS